jgi:hypothetical protein
MGFQDMVCAAGTSNPAGANSCKTRETGAEGVQIACGRSSSPKKDSPVYICVPVIRDWGRPSPYAHTSHVWRCQDGDAEILLFDADFLRDPVRCELVCGRCATEWLAGP